MEDPSAIYMAGRREWNERYGSYIAQARNWRLIAAGSLLTTCVAVGACVWQSTQSRVVPFIVEVNKLGDTLAVSRAGIEPKISDRIIRGSIARWIKDVRTVSTDLAGERAMLKEAAAMTDQTGTAYPKLKSWLEAHNPSNENTDHEVGVTVTSVHPLSNDTWRVEWDEERRPLNGSGPIVSHWNATLTINLKEPVSDQQILENPPGIYIQSFDWGQPS